MASSGEKEKKSRKTSSYSSDESSSESSDGEYLVTPGKLDLDSTFFASSKASRPATTSFAEATNESSSESDDDDFDQAKIDSNALLAEVMKNLENAKKNVISDEEDKQNSAADEKKSCRKSSNENGLSDEIANLLLQGESGVSTVRPDDEDQDDDDDDNNRECATERPEGYTVPKEGVDVTLPSSALALFGRHKKKRRQNLEDELRKRMNRRLRKNQIFIHKVGLLCWLAHGFRLNTMINDTEIMSVVLSLIPSSSYPKGRADLKYLEGFTRWFKNLFKLEFKENTGDQVGKETLLARLAAKKIHNHRELVLLYAAALRAIGLHCRLVISLCPPALKPRADQLFRAPSEKEDETAKASSSKGKKKTTDKGKRATGESTACRSNKSRTKIVPENGEEMRRTAQSEAKKKAAEVLAKFANNRNKKSIKSLTEEKKIPPSPEKVKKKIVSPTKPTRQLRSRVITQKSGPVVAAESTEIEDEKLRDDGSPGDKRKNAAKNLKTSTSTMSDSDSDDDFVVEVPAKKKKTVVKKDEDSGNIGETPESGSKSQNRQNRLPGKKKRAVACKQKKNRVETDDDSEGDSEKKRPVKKLRTESLKKESQTRNPDSPDRRIFSSDDEADELVDASGAQNIWLEVFVESEESWISVNVVDDKIHCVSEIYKKAPKPVLYVVAWNSVGSLKDVTRRYCPHWLTVTRKQRVDDSWWVETLSSYEEKSTTMSRAEDEMLLQRELEQPLPKTVGECKGHPLYALARHLLKFEAIYPPESVPLGHLRTGEAIYSRYCVHTLCSRETWIKKARVVKPAQDPYKVVKSLPKYDKLSGIKLPDQPLQLFGKWQTTQYVPPVAKDGKVPRNEYGNVDLFKACMLPTGTVHINLPALNRVARKLNIDCAVAVVGFTFGARGALPATEGYVVCEEFEDTLRAAWQEDQIESAKRATEKREKRIYGNWKKLIKGLFIRERLAARYDFNMESKDDEKPSTSGTKSTKKTESKKVEGKKTKN